MTEEKESVLTIGEILRQKRLYLKIQILDASSFLRVKTQDLEAIENDNFSAVTKHIYLLGLIRSYAKYLKIDNDIIEEKIRNIFVRSNVDNKEHKLINLGEESEITPPKDMFFNFLLIASLLFFILLSLVNSFESKSSLNSEKIIKEMENISLEK